MRHVNNKSFMYDRTLDMLGLQAFYTDLSVFYCFFLIFFWLTLAVDWIPFVAEESVRLTKEKFLFCSHSSLPIE